MQLVCGASGCNSPTSLEAGEGLRQLNGVEFCRGCYQRIYRTAKKDGKTMQEVFSDGLLPLPQRPLPRPAITCERKGCVIHLPENADTNVRKMIGFFHVCRGCFSRAWEKAKADEISLEEAFHQLKPKGKPEPPKVVTCSLPWCTLEVVPDNTSLAYDNFYACGHCRRYLKKVGERLIYQGKNWKMLVKGAMDGFVPAPHTEEVCVMPWCKLSKPVRQRGPNGEAICHADSVYLWYYRKRHGLTFEEAFRTAPRPSAPHSRFAKKE